MLKGPADALLHDATEQLKLIIPDARHVVDGFRHVTFRELIFNEQGRRAAGIDAQRACDYYQPLRKRFETFTNPIQLELYKVFPALDKEFIDEEQKSVSLVAGFLPKDNLNFLTVRQRISEIERPDLRLTSRLGEIRVLFSTFARFPIPPKQEGAIPFLNALTEINATIPKNCEAIVDTIDLFGNSLFKIMRGKS